MYAPFLSLLWISVLDRSLMFNNNIFRYCRIMTMPSSAKTGNAVTNLPGGWYVQAILLTNGELVKPGHTCLKRENRCGRSDSRLCAENTHSVSSQSNVILPVCQWLEAVRSSVCETPHRTISPTSLNLLWQCDDGRRSVTRRKWRRYCHMCNRRSGYLTIACVNILFSQSG
jgi:hypothetical protein